MKCSQVSDSGSPRQSARAPATVIVYVSDVNDSPPIFSQSRYEATLLLPTHENILVVMTSATDDDSPVYSQLTYSILSGNDDGQFKVDPVTGALLINNPDAMLDEYDLVIKVTDGSYESTCRVRVHVDMAQNTGLSFTELEYAANVIENSTVVEDVVVVQARGHDVNEHVTFAILNPSESFAIGETSGVIRSTGLTLDREQQVRA